MCSPSFHQGVSPVCPQRKLQRSALVLEALNLHRDDCVNDATATATATADNKRGGIGVIISAITLVFYLRAALLQL